MCKKCSNSAIETTIKEEIYPLTNQPMFRPKVSFGRAISCVVGTMTAIGLLVWILLQVFSQYEWYAAVSMTYRRQFTLLYLLIWLTVIVFSLKPIIIFIIRIYQRYMPYDIRCNCLFVPNCSEYMVLAIEKYGVFKGVKMGIRRLLRCREPNGGEDYP